MILIYILEFFPGKKFTYWNFSQGKSLHFGIFPREKVYILEFFPGKKFTFWNFSRDFKTFPRGKEREKFQNVNFSPLQIGTFSFPGWKRFFFPSKLRG